MEAITVSKFRSNLKHYMDFVEESRKTLFVPRNGTEQEGVVVLGKKDYNSLMETLYLMSSPENHRRLLEGIRQAEEGMVVIKQLDELGV